MLAGHVIYTLPFMLRSVIAVMVAIDMKTLEEGAASLGAGFTRRFLTPHNLDFAPAAVRADLAGQQRRPRTRMVGEPAAVTGRTV